jgi:RNA polymerase sigma factor (sigma-70 family)
MTDDLSWTALIARIEKDVRLRGTPSELPADESAWNLVERHLRYIAHTLRRSGLHSLSDFDDIIGETLLKLQSLDTIRKLKAAGSEKGYLIVIMRNAALDLRRQEKRQKTVLDEAAYLQPAPLSQEEIIVTVLDANPLDSVIAQLSTDDRYLIRLHFWRKMSIQQIADRIGLSYSATATRLFRILRRMRQLYSDSSSTGS